MCGWARAVARRPSTRQYAQTAHCVVHDDSGELRSIERERPRWRHKNTDNLQHQPTIVHSQHDPSLRANCTEEGRHESSNTVKRVVRTVKSDVRGLYTS